VSGGGLGGGYGCGPSIGAGRVAVTGATGFLGRALARRLRARGVEVIGLGRAAGPLDALAGEGVLAMSWDLRAPAPPELVRSMGAVEAVVHCGALSAPWGRLDDFLAANVEGTRHALDLAEALGARRFVNISSPSVGFALRDQIGVREDAPTPRPINHYARSKGLAEALVLARSTVGPVNLRPRGVYGAGETALLPRLLRAARARPLPLLRGGAAAIDLTHVRDATSAIEAALAAPREAEGETFNVSGGEMRPVREIVERACAAVGARARWRAMPLAPLLWAARLAEAASLAIPGAREPAITPYSIGLFAFRQSLDLGKAERLLGWRPRVSLEEGFAETFAEAAR
jgi:nucleoside-diphosphate-sugar epimerase